LVFDARQHAMQSSPQAGAPSPHSQDFARM
jgi:hypothetical protein